MPRQACIPLLCVAICSGQTCPPAGSARAGTEETQTVSFFQFSVLRRQLLQERRTGLSATAPDGSLAAGRATPLQSIAYDGAWDPTRLNASVAAVYGNGTAAGARGRSALDMAWRQLLRAGAVSGLPGFEDLAPTLKFPEGADIWNVSLSWANVTLRHPGGVISNLATKKVQWASVSYISLDSLYIVSLVAYPAVFIFCLLALTVLTGVCMAAESGGEDNIMDEGGAREEVDFCECRAAIPESAPEATPEAAEATPEAVEAPDADLGIGSSLALHTADLSWRARQIFGWWSLFCRTIPAWMVFGTPALLLALSYPYPQEVFLLLVVVSSVLVFSNGLYMAFFCPFILVKMREAMSGRHLLRMPKAMPGTPEAQVVHWVVLPNYKEAAEVLSDSLESIAQSPIATEQICVLLAMEERETDATQKAEKLQADFSGRFREVGISMHPPGLPNDPPGKASNMAWAFRWLTRHVEEVGQDPERVVITVADADSDFHPLYFRGLGRQFVETDPSRRALRIWQAPVFHVKNYHRQPMPVIVGTMFTAMAEIAVLADPNSIRFPYSTYSLSMQLARRVGGWDAEWIAEDWHMGIKCFLLTMAESEVEAVLLPTVNYMPEDSSWIGTLYARWIQAKRHALGFSDMSYYFMMLPLLFCRLSRNQGKGGGPNLQDFWRMFFFGLAYIIRLVNTHVVVGILTLYMIMSVLLKSVMKFALQDLRHVGQLFDRSTAACGAFFVTSVVSIAIMTLSFQVVYASLKDRMDPANSGWRCLFAYRFLHWVYTFVACAAFAPVYCTGLAAAVWIAAIKVLMMGTFEYEVAAKPTKNAHL